MSKRVRPILLMTILSLSAFSLGCQISSIPPDLGKDLITRWNEVGSFSADLRATSHVNVGPAISTSEVTGTLEWSKTSGRIHYRIHDFTKSVIDTGQNTIRSTYESISTDDGLTTNAWIRHKNSATFNQIEIEKRSERSNGTHGYLIPGGTELLKSLKDSYQSILIEYGTHERFPVTIINCHETLAPELEGTFPNRYQVSISTEFGVPLKSVLMNEAGDIVTTISYSNIKIDPNIDSARFTHLHPKFHAQLPGIRKKD